jgi:FKBP-type peptidyl-prolyl cis-trans isomerase (trigger factor)
MVSTVQTHDNGTLEITITVPWADVDTTYKSVFARMVAEAELPGFRKGKAPANLVEEQTDKTKVYEEVIRQLVPKAYSDAVTEHTLKPIMMPKIELKEAAEGKDWVVLATTCTKPTVTLGDYKKGVQELKATKAKKIWVPGQDAPKPEDEEKEKKITLDELIDAVLANITIAIPPILLEHEVNHQLSGLLDQARKLGLTIEQYLASTNRTADGLREEYTRLAGRTLSLEFALETIADAEKIEATDEDIQKVLAGAKSEEEKKTLEKEKYYLTSMLRRQKTIDFLAAV